MAKHQAPAIAPPEGAPIRAPFGDLKTVRGLHLVRLEDVHAWMMQRHGLPSAPAAARVFGAFASDAGSAVGMKHGATKVRELLHLVDLAHFAEPVSGFAGRYFLREVAVLVPHVRHHHFDRGTPEALMYSLGLVAGEVWAPHAVDIDLNERLAGYMPEGNFPTVAKAREIVGRLAVSYAAAHALWGWGSVGAAEAVAPAPAPVAAVADPLGALDPDLRAAFEAVCKRRAACKDAENGARELWTDDDVATVCKVRDAMGRTGAKTIAPLLFMSDNNVRKLGKRKPKAQAKAPMPKANDPFSTVRPKAA
jgi:hypothetical protein